MGREGLKRQPPEKGSVRLGTPPLRAIFVVAVDVRELWKPRFAPSDPKLVARLSQSRLVERAWIEVDFVGNLITGVDGRAASAAGISPPVLGALKFEHVALDCHRIDGKHDVEVEGRAMDFAAGQAMTDADSVRLASRLEPHFAARAPAFMDVV
jgi:hypothetical protein